LPEGSLEVGVSLKSALQLEEAHALSTGDVISEIEVLEFREDFFEVLALVELRDVTEASVVGLGKGEFELLVNQLLFGSIRPVHNGTAFDLVFTKQIAVTVDLGNWEESAAHG
jgi:hypothetical protein